MRSGAWEELYGKRSQDFISGVIAGLEMFAWWNDGTQYVGTCGTTLKDAIQSVREELSEEIK